MNLAELEQKLLAAARADVPSDRVPYAFEQRILAQVRARTTPDGRAFWARSLWRAALGCVAVMVMLSAFSYALPASPDQSLSQEFESTVLAPVHQEDGQF
jgi:hypothetical protein